MATGGLVNLTGAVVPGLSTELLEAGAGRALPVLSGRVAAAEIGVLLLLGAWGLLRGSRLAWWVATLAGGTATLIGGVTHGLTLAVVVSALTTAVLISTRGSFRLRPRPGLLARVRVPIAMGLGLLAYGVSVYAEIDALVPGSLGDRTLRILRTMVLLPGGVQGEQTLVEAFGISLGVGTFAVLVAVIWARWRPSRPSGNAGTGLRELAERHGTTSVAPLLALPDVTPLPLCDGAAHVGMAVRSGVAVCLGAPIAPPELETAALVELVDVCERSGLTPVLLATDERQQTVAMELGFAGMPLGLEAVLDVASFTTAGKRRSNVRHSVTRARKEGLTVLRYDASSRSARRDQQLGEISAAWLATKGGPELGFTLGRFDTARLDEQEVYVAVLRGGEACEQVVGFVTWLPYAGGDAAVLDLMRRADPCPPGTMEALLVDSIADFARRGRRRASLGGVPLAAQDERRGAVASLLGWVYEHGGSVYDARGLFRFKDKFDPTWEPMYVAYPVAVDLPRTAIAVLRAVLPRGMVRHAVSGR